MRHDPATQDCVTNGALETLPPTWIAGGATNEAERDAALLLQGAFGETTEVCHPAVGGRMRARLAERLEERRRRTAMWAKLAYGGAIAVVFVAFGIGKLVVSDDLGSFESKVLKGTLVAVGQQSQPRIQPGGWLGPDMPVSCAVATCELNINDAVHVVLRQDAVFSIRNKSRTELHSGYATFAVKPRPPGESFSIRLDETLVEVVGTAFSVEMRDGERRVAVSEGTVRITENGRVSLVKAGQTWSNRTGNSGTPQETAEVPSDSGVALVDEAKTVSGVAEQDADPAMDQPTSAEALADDAGAMFERAAKAKKHGELESARSIYSELAARSSSVGELGMYLSAELELRERHDPKAARKILAELDQRFPKGTLQLERRLTEIEAVIACGECEAAAALVENLAQTSKDAAAPMIPELRQAVAACANSR